MSRFFRERPSSRRITSGQIRVLQRLWSTRIRREGKFPTRESDLARWRERVSAIVGRPVRAPQELRWREANQLIRRWLEETACQGPMPTAGGPPSSSREEAATPC